MTDKKYYPEVAANPDFPKLEENILKFWRENGIFEDSVKNREAKKDGADNEFIFYDGPPFANGLPHYGHLLTGFVKDIFGRYQTVKGKKVERRFGWDCHGLPAEMGAEKELGISGRHKIVEHGIDNFNDTCRTSVMKFSGEWKKYVERQARWVDFENGYKTMDKNYMESVLWAFSELYKKGLVYESMRVMPYSWACETPLSNFETRMDNSYRERTDKAATVAFELAEKPKGAPDADSYRVLAWTTTPWTLPSNLALAVGEDIEYACAVVDKNSDGSLSPFGERAGVRGQRDGQLIKNARELRANSTEVEKKLWSELRGRRFEDYKFRRQHDIDKYIVDFVCLKQKLVIELDGGHHSEDKQKKHDEERTKYLESLGYTVLRFWNNEINENFEGALEVIYNSLNDTPPNPLPKEGEGASQCRGYKVCYITATSSLAKYTKELKIEEDKEFTKIKASDLVGLSYKPLFPYFADKAQEGAFKIIAADFVTEGDGTGIVHLAPGFGEDDFEACKKENISGLADPKVAPVCPVDNSGCYTDEIFDIDGETPLSLKGLNVIAQVEGKFGDEPYKEKQLQDNGLANLRIINYLKMTGQLMKMEDYKHNYPHCWRTDTPLIYKAVPSWYVEVTKFKDRMVELNQEINWIPGHVKDGQFGKWLENARDWSISRNRFWGAPIPIWKSDNPKNEKLYVFGSIGELEEFFDTKVEDLHRPYIDELTKPDPENSEYTLRRVEDVFDCWFESGSMPYAQAHYPFENKDWFEDHFPADFIVEYVAQTRGWFYTLMVLSTALFDRPPFLNVICHGVVLDDKGQKLSKRLQNYADPMDVFERFGSDAMRWVMISAPIMHGGELLIDKEGNMIRDAVRLVMKPIWNSYSFFALYANADGIEARFHPSSDNLMDRYILAKCKDAVFHLEKAMDAYDTPLACQRVEGFFEVLNNWYIRRNKDRFWRSEKDTDKYEAYNTLYSVLHIMCRAVSPLLPLLAEEIWLGLGNKDSVHLQDFPDLQDVQDEAHLMHDMDRVRDACNAALSIRSAENLRVRQPLASLTIVDPQINRLEDYADLIKDEVNVKEVKFSADVESFASHKLKVNFPVLGKRIPAKMKDVIAATKQGKWQQNEDGLIEAAGEVLTEEECSLLLEPKNGKGAQALSSNDALVLLNLDVSDQLKIEGIARDMVRFIQQSRKDADLNITDRISLNVETANSDIKTALINFAEYIAEQTLAESVEEKSAANCNHRFEQKIDGGDVVIGFSKAK